jgi:(p)ppGpp synthase/HD superfamily hydrolase
MKYFEHESALSFEEAAALLKESPKGKTVVMAGGSDLVGVLKEQLLKEYPEKVVNLKTIEGERLIEVFWDDEPLVNINYESILSILSFDRKNIVVDVINTINSNSISIKSISSSKTKTGEILTKVKVSVKDLQTLERAITNLEKNSDIYSIERVMR